jgi:glycosyltransferase involved in cell wall biosynthesis
LAFRRAKKIITISEATKNDTVSFFNVEPQKVSVVYPGFTRICDLNPDNVEIPVGQFFFFVGTLKERKNVFNIVQGFISFKKNNSDKPHKLVIAGKYNKRSGYIKKILKFIEKKNSQGDIIFLEHITDAQLSFLYKNAEALLFPSRLEGFGLPVLEAMDCGLPVITSNQSSLAEVGGDAAILVDPYDIDDIAQAIKKMATDNTLKQELISKGHTQAQKFSWEKAAKELLQVISKVS